VGDGEPPAVVGERSDDKRAEWVDDEDAEQDPEAEDDAGDDGVPPERRRRQGFAISRTQRSTIRLRLAPA
jgi:hypothetical protein